MESEPCIDAVNDLACILDTFFKGLSECGFLSTYSVQLQAFGSDAGVHLQFRQVIYQVVRSMQGLLCRLSRTSGFESMTVDTGVQTESAYSEPLCQDPSYLSSSQSVDSGVITKDTPEVPMKVLMTGLKSSLDSKLRLIAPCENEINADGDFIEKLHKDSSTIELGGHSLEKSTPASQQNPLSETTHGNDKITSTLSSLQTETGFSIDSSRLKLNCEHLSSTVSSSAPNSRKIARNHKVFSNRIAFIATPCAESGSHNVAVERHHILDSACSEFSGTNQIHSIDTSPSLVSQDLIAVLGSEDVVGQQQPTVLFLATEDPRGDISNDVAVLQERQINDGDISMEEDENVHHNHSMYSYSSVVQGQNSGAEKIVKVDISSSLRDNEDDLVLFCKDEVELESMASVGTVDKDGELMSIFTAESGKEDEDNSSTILYSSGNVLNDKKKSISKGKDAISDNFFSKKLIRERGRSADFELIAIKMEDINSRCSEEGQPEFSKRHSEEHCPQLPGSKDEQGSGEDIMAMEGAMDPEDTLGSNFVHIVVTASRVTSDDVSEGKEFDAPSKPKCTRCLGKNSSECSCNTCETEFPILSSVQCQLKKKHGYVSQCDFCHKVFPTMGSLVDHCRDVHDGAGCFECEECGKRLKSRLSLRRHIESHQGRKEAICSKCGKTFCRWDYLIRHCQMVHAKERPYQCSQCSRRFLSRGHLQNHLAVHSGERNHKCEICGKMFSRSDKLREHTFRHSSTKRYSCPTCGRSYADKRDLSKHQMRESNCNAGKTGHDKNDLSNETDKSIT
ncbi:uncharacterized protein LOC124169960 [Ischnura elegans]|uniref:uncharacterized protein LOC124169960 n=1 Tax=Ischnura elegans TaxID=197161 RepID=UPI001ED895F7|nr:uncharacterized protein LOC124169960 [Ischnura elegans]